MSATNLHSGSEEMVSLSTVVEAAEITIVIGRVFSVHYKLTLKL